MLVLPDGPPGVPASLSRFRLATLHAALETGTPIRVIGVRGTSSILEPRNGKSEAGNSNVKNGKAEVRLSDPLRPGVKDSCDLVALREHIRKAIAELCG